MGLIQNLASTQNQHYLILLDFVRRSTASAATVGVFI
jgi:hypothetical protein